MVDDFWEREGMVRLRGAYGVIFAALRGVVGCWLIRCWGDGMGRLRDSQFPVVGRIRGGGL
jgi:hypothetical protein